MELSDAQNALSAEADRFRALLVDVRDPSRLAIGKWTIAETAAHVAFVFEHVPAYLAGTEVLPGSGEDFERLADAHTAYNDDALASDPERNLSLLAAKTVDGARRMSETASRVDWVKRVPWFGGVDVSPGFYMAVAVNELLVHGLDIARAAGRKWPVERSSAVLVAETFLTVFPHYLDRQAAAGVDARYELRFRGSSTAHFLTFDDGALTVTTQRTGPVDCHISADPWWWTLVGYGRASQWRAVLRGKIATWGRRPWLATKLGRLTALP
ncbi:MAG: maleylpyruvate isomerase N-terminal domain-containing protein [Actinomycetota bacterium]|nr:maleylpyruvate isomerase N-terminal domain-containing protein [Actinomycetota bacterium]